MGWTCLRALVCVQLFEEIRKSTYVGILPAGFLFTKEYSDINTHLHNFSASQ